MNVSGLVVDANLSTISGGGGSSRSFARRIHDARCSASRALTRTPSSSKTHPNQPAPSRLSRSRGLARVGSSATPTGGNMCFSAPRSWPGGGGGRNVSGIWMSVARSPESPSSARDVAPRARRVETSDAFPLPQRRAGASPRRAARAGRGRVAAVSAARVACAAASVMPRGRRARGRREGGGRDAAGRGARGETRRAETGEICGRRGLRAVEAELSNDRGARRETRGRRRARGGGVDASVCRARGDARDERRVRMRRRVRARPNVPCRRAPQARPSSLATPGRVEI